MEVCLLQEQLLLRGLEFFVCMLLSTARLLVHQKCWPSHQHQVITGFSFPPTSPSYRKTLTFLLSVRASNSNPFLPSASAPSFLSIEV